MNPRVAVITPTRNRLRLLCEAMDSVRQQHFNAWEHIIIDDGSDDGTSDEVRRRAADDPRIRYVQRTGENAGANVCRNIGIGATSAELIVFLDSDDLLRRHCLGRRVELMDRNSDLDFAVFRAEAFRRSAGDLGRLYHTQDPGDDLLRFLTHECVWEISGPIWRRRFLERIEAFDESLLSMQDLEMHVRALCWRGRYVCFADVDHDIRWQDDAAKTSVRHFNDPAYIEAAERVRLRLLDAVSSAGLLTWSRRRALTGLCFGNAERLVQAGHTRQGLRLWMRGCCEQQDVDHLLVLGTLMLCARSLRRTDHGLTARLINKWKGWARFRQEPALPQRRARPSALAGDSAV